MTILRYWRRRSFYSHLSQNMFCKVWVKCTFLSSLALNCHNSWSLIMRDSLNFLLLWENNSIPYSLFCCNILSLRLGADNWTCLEIAMKCRIITYSIISSTVSCRKSQFTWCTFCISGPTSQSPSPKSLSPRLTTTCFCWSTITETNKWDRSSRLSSSKYLSSSSQICTPTSWFSSLKTNLFKNYCKKS